jgi:phage-related protein
LARLFLPITLILGVIDGVQGFMKEFGETGSILDGIRGAVVGIVDGFIGGLVRLVGSAVEWILGFFGLDNLGKSINEKINQLMDFLKGIIGGITDLISGLFSFDGERIMKGLGAMFSGVGGFFLNILSAPIDLAVNFIKDLFGFGDPDKPFSLKTWLFGGDGEKGLIGRIWDSIKSVFTLPEGGIYQDL